MSGLPLEAVVAIAGWLCGVVLVFIGWKKLPLWAKAAWAKGVSNPKDPARVAFSGAVEADVLPKVKTLIADEVRPLMTRLGDLDAQRQRAESAMAELKATLSTFKEGVEALQPLGRMVEVPMEGGEVKRELAINMTLASTINSLNGLIDWISADPATGQGLAALFEASLIRAKEYDVLAENGARGNAALRAKAEAAGLKAAEHLTYLQDHPELAAQGQQLKEAEDALDEILGGMGMKDGAFKTWAMGSAKRALIQGQMEGLQPGVQAGRRPPQNGGFQPM